MGSSPLVDPNSFTENIFDTKLSIQVFTMKLLMQASGRKVLGFESSCTNSVLTLSSITLNLTSRGYAGCGLARTTIEDVGNV